MANVLFSRTSDPSSKPITDGQLIFDTSGNGKMYLDVGSERMEMGGARTVDPVLNSSSENPIQNKAVAGVMLDNMTDVNAVTGSGFLPDALAIKELDTDLQGQINILNRNLDESKILQVDINTIGFTIPSRSIALVSYDQNLIPNGAKIISCNILKLEGSYDDGYISIIPANNRCFTALNSSDNERTYTSAKLRVYYL